MVGQRFQPASDRGDQSIGTDKSAQLLILTRLMLSRKQLIEGAEAFVAGNGPIDAASRCSKSVQQVGVARHPVFSKHRVSGARNGTS